MFRARPAPARCSVKAKLQVVVLAPDGKRANERGRTQARLSPQASTCWPFRGEEARTCIAYFDTLTLELWGMEHRPLLLFIALVSSRETVALALVIREAFASN